MALVDTCLDYPLLVNITAYHTPDRNINALSNSFSGFRELLTRKDAGSALLARYRTLPPDHADASPTERIQHTFIALALLPDAILDTMSQEDLLNLAIVAFRQARATRMTRGVSRDEALSLRLATKLIIKRNVSLRAGGTIYNATWLSGNDFAQFARTDVDFVPEPTSLDLLQTIAQALGTTN
jgi:hypothetical protein